MTRILIATKNPGKYRELMEALYFRSDITFVPPTEIDFPEPKEDGDSFKSNALIKARSAATFSGLPTLGEDSGLIVEAFPERFGLRTRREIDADTDEEWLERFLVMLEGVEDRRATFYSSLAFVDPETKTEAVFLGSTSGEITLSPQSELEQGVPVSAVFRPDGETAVYSALGTERKNQISHRGKAARDMIAFLEEFYTMDEE